MIQVQNVWATYQDGSSVEVTGDCGHYENPIARPSGVKVKIFSNEPNDITLYHGFLDKNGSIDGLINCTKIYVDGNDAISYGRINGWGMNNLDPTNGILNPDIYGYSRYVIVSAPDDFSGCTLSNYQTVWGPCDIYYTNTPNIPVPGIPGVNPVDLENMIISEIVGTIGQLPSVNDVQRPTLPPLSAVDIKSLAPGLPVIKLCVTGFGCIYSAPGVNGQGDEIGVPCNHAPDPCCYGMPGCPRGTIGIQQYCPSPSCG